MLRPRLVVLAVGALALVACTRQEVQVLDHFKCYAAQGALPEHRALALRDQFHLEEGVRLMELNYFCNPVTKTIDGEKRPAQPDEDHLTCYRIEPEDPFPAAVGIRNQFGEAELETIKSELLCVPTHKYGFEVAETPPPSCPGGEGCCCNMPDGAGGTWPDCGPGFECRRQANPTDPNDAIQVCVPNGTPPGAPLQLHPSQPPFCRQ